MIKSGHDMPFFIVGSPRSGTTLLVRMLNQHPEIFIPPETEFFLKLDQYQYGHGKLNTTQFPTFIDWYLSTSTANFLNIDVRIKERLLLYAKEPVDVFSNLMKILLERSGKERWGEKTPEHVHYTKLICSHFPNALFVLVIRDGRAIVNSRLKHPEWNDNLYSAARKWKRDIHAGIQLKKEMGKNCLEIRYETLVSEPEMTLRTVLDFLGEENTLLYEEEEDHQYRKYYEQPWMRNSNSDPDTKRISAWREQFTSKQIRVIEFFIGDPLKKLGYNSIQPSAHPGWIIVSLKEIIVDCMRRVILKLIRQLTIFSGRHI